MKPQNVVLGADVPQELAAGVLRALEKDRERRFPDAEAMARALAPWLEPPRVPERTERMKPAVAAPRASEARTRPLVPIVVGGVAIAAAVATCAMWLHARGAAVVAAPPIAETAREPSDIAFAVPSAAPARSVLVVTEPNDATISVTRAGSVSVLGLAPQIVEAADPVVVIVERVGYRSQTLTLDANTAARLDVKLERAIDVPPPPPRPTLPKRIDVGACLRPASCPKESWDPFECRCRGL